MPRKEQYRKNPEAYIKKAVEYRSKKLLSTPQYCKACGKDLPKERRIKRFKTCDDACSKRAKYLRNRKYQKKMVELIQRIKLSVGCQFCGYDKCAYCLDLHHINENDKTINFADLRFTSIPKLKSEIEKCVVLCRNCHTELHYMVIKEYYD